MTKRQRQASILPLVLAALALAHVNGVHADPDPVRFLRPEVQQFSALLSASGTPPTSEVGRLLDQTVAWEELTQRAFGEYLGESLDSYRRRLSPDEQKRLVDHYRTRLARVLRQRVLGDLVHLAGSDRVTSLAVVAHDLGEENGEVELAAQTADGPLQARGMLQRVESSWLLVDLAIGDRWLSARYRDQCRHIVAARYSPAVLESSLLQRDYIVVEDFSGTPVDQLPADWGTLWDKDREKPLLYGVQQVNGKPYLAARDTGSSVILGKLINWNPREYPIMTWCWKANALPAGGDERYADTNDSAAGIYVVFAQNWLGAYRQLKYVWSSTLPVGTMERRNKVFRPWFVVVESGPERLGRWTFEQVDLYAHHLLKLGGRPDDSTISVGILTDANSTRSYAEAYYADIRVWRREALDAGEVEDYCDCLSEQPPQLGRDENTD